MSDHPELERRVDALEQELLKLKLRRPRGLRFRSSLALGELPLLAVAIGPDLERGELRGHAKGVIAIGDIATGVLALGGLARGLVACGGLAIGALTLGGLSLGALAAFGGAAVGSLAIGGAALGGAAIGGGAAGYYACGGEALGSHTVSPRYRDPEALAFFARYGLESVCRGK